MTPKISPSSIVMLTSSSTLCFWNSFVTSLSWINSTGDYNNSRFINVMGVVIEWWWANCWFGAPPGKKYVHSAKRASEHRTTRETSYALPLEVYNKFLLSTLRGRVRTSYAHTERKYTYQTYFFSHHNLYI